MTPDDILYAPLNKNEPWRDLCRDIVQYIEDHRRPERHVLPLDRKRPNHALFLEEFLEAYHLRGISKFWRVSYPSRLTVLPFDFAGYIALPDAFCKFPSFGEWMRVAVNLRSIEDANLVPNGYCHDYIFDDVAPAWDGLRYLIKYCP